MQTRRYLAPVVGTVFVASLLLTSIGTGWSEQFKIIERQKIEREMVWFNGREGDFEHKPFLKEGRVYVTLVDLMRHIKGTILKGPPSDLIELERNSVLVRVLPGESYVLINGVEADVERAPVKHVGALYVPLRFYCNLFGIAVEWSRIEHRAYVTFRTD